MRGRLEGTAVSKPTSLNVAKSIMATIRQTVSSLIPALMGLGTQQVRLKALEEALNDAAGLEHTNERSVIGFSFDGFWDEGTDVIRRVQQVLSSADVQSLQEE